MNVVYSYLDIVCRSASGEEVKFYAEDYYESIDEIRIRTGARNDQLNRGWMGDLMYSARHAHDIEFGTEVESLAQATYKDVLLASITVCNVDEYVVWEYRFLKK